MDRGIEKYPFGRIGCVIHRKLVGEIENPLAPVSYTSYILQSVDYTS